MGGLAMTDLPTGTAMPDEPEKAEVCTRIPTSEVRPMPSLRDHLIRTSDVRYRNLSAWIRALGERATPVPDRCF